MWGRRVGSVVACVLCAALVAACGDDDEPGADAGVPGDDVASDGPDAGGGLVYSGELSDGSELVVRLDVPSSDPAVAPFDELREVTGAAEPTWIVGEVTTPAGVEGTGRFVTFLEAGADRMEDDPADDSDGVTNAEFACSVMEDWFAGAEVKDDALTDAYMEVYDGQCGGQAHQVIAPAGETTTYVMAYDGDIPDFETIEAELGNPLSPA